MQATTTHGIAYATPSDPHKLDVVTQALAASVDAALTAAYFYEGASYQNLPTSPSAPQMKAGKTMARTTSDNRLWIWSGTQWLLHGGSLPRGIARPSAGAHPIGTGFQAFQMVADGILTLNGGVIPAGCGGVYDWSFTGRIDNPASNVFIRPYVGSAPVGPAAFVSGGQEQIGADGYVALNPGDVFTVRLRVFAGSTTLQGDASQVKLIYRCAA